MKGLVYHTNPYIYLFDHVAPFSYMMDFPLLYTQEHLSKPLSKYYPEVPFLYIPAEQVNYQKLALEYEVFVQTFFWKENLFSYFASCAKKPATFCYLSHGSSDKGYLESRVMGGLELQEVAFFSGEQSKDRLIKQNLYHKIKCPIFMGNVRKRYYQKFAAYLDELAQIEVFSQLKKKNTTLFYAPTWNDIEQSTSFFSLTEKLLYQLPKHWNLIIKPHPLLEEENPALYYHFLWKAQNQENVLLLQDFPLIYPILNKCDAYLGDFSSIGYDALTFQKPLFFYDLFHRKLSDPCRTLHQCGISLKESDLKNLYGFLENHINNYPKELFQKQKEMDHYTFGVNEPMKTTRSRILKLLKKENSSLKVV